MAKSKFSYVETLFFLGQPTSFVIVYYTTFFVLHNLRVMIAGQWSDPVGVRQKALG